MDSLFKRMQAVQDRLLDHMNEAEPNANAVLATFERAYAAMREAAEALRAHKDSGSVPEEVQQAVNLGSHFGNLMQRVKEHMDASQRRATIG